MANGRYEDVYFAQGDEAIEWLIKIDCLGAKETIAALAAVTHYPGEHDTRDSIGNGTSDTIASWAGYVLAWNPALGYVGLVYDTQYNEKGGN